MKKLMAMADSWMRKEQISLAVLGGARQRYQYFGYTKGGMHLRYTIDSGNLRHALKNISTDGFEIQEITEASDTLLMQIHALQQLSPIHTERNTAELFDILRNYGRHLYVLLENGCFSGYFTASGKSVSELCVKNPEHYKTALKLWMQSSCLESLEVSVSAWDCNLMCALDAIAEYVSIETDGNYKVYDWAAVLPALLSLKGLSSGHISDGSCSLCIDGQPLEVCCTGGRISVSDKPSCPEDC